MPGPGDQHSGIANPFEEAKPRISEYTAVQIATLQSRLEKQLGPEYLSSRKGPGGQKVHYIAADKCIALANDVFGFNGWSSSIQNIQVDFVDENPQTLKISLGLSVIVRVTLRDGTYHEDIGYGHMENSPGKAGAFEKAKKEGTTDALKRTLRNFGNVLGNCIYDKDYLAKVTKIKTAPTRFDEDNLHRHADFVKKEQAVVKAEPKNLAEQNGDTTGSLVSAAMLEDEFGDDFDMADFGVTEDGHPDEVVLSGSHEHGVNSSEKSQALPAGNASRSSTSGAPAPRPMQPPSRPNAQPPRPPQTPNQPQHRPAPSFQSRSNPQQPQQQQPRPPSHVNNTAQQAATARRTNTPPPNVQKPPNGTTAANAQHAPNGAPAEPVAFFSARAVKDVPEDVDPGTVVIADKGAKVFNPHAESPSIRKTPGIDHKSSKPLARNGQHVQPVKKDEEEQRTPTANGQSNGADSGPGRAGMANPALTHARQIGAPGGGGSPLGNRGQYKPPTMKRPAPNGPDGGNRAPLTEVSANGVTNNGAGPGGLDAKRQRMA
ncbi:Uu.00g096460.m01.CDS01 [Anthostomella pinea]|uniref:RAD52 homolog n=1 Tax=Anthostomella pinea TaxID=933095 RepID=A0AAI8VCS2_9PEZI|nr:Uu.00g096460.m01.CDS01 [Anthostomella pinea]